MKIFTNLLKWNIHVHLNQIDKLKVSDQRLNIYQVHPQFERFSLKLKKDFDLEDLCRSPWCYPWTKFDLYLTAIFRSEHILSIHVQLSNTTRFKFKISTREKSPANQMPLLNTVSAVKQFFAITDTVTHTYDSCIYDSFMTIHLFENPRCYLNIRFLAFLISLVAFMTSWVR